METVCHVDAEEMISSCESEFSLPLQINCVLTLEAGTLSHLPEKVFQTPELRSVKEVILQGSNIQNLPRSFTSNLHCLEILKIDSNKLYELPDNMRNLVFLKNMSVSHNNLSDLPNDVSFLVHLEYLDISYNEFSGVPICITSLINLKHLNMCNNNISTLPDEIGAMVNLEHLNVSNNIVLSLPHSMGNLKNLVYMNISSNSISELPDSLHSSKLLFFILSHNVFKRVPDCIINNLPYISVLDFSYNRIMFFDTPPKCVGKLIKLDLSNNIFHDIPQWLFGEKCKLLQELNISDNKHMIGVSEPSAYSKRGDVLGVSKSLKILKASNCCFSSSSVEFLYGLKALESLTLGNEISFKNESKHIGNILFNFPTKTLNTCTNLKYLNMNKVGLADLPEDIGNLLPKLEVLDMSFNQLMNLPESFCKLVTLTSLQVSSNELRNLPGEFGLLSTLEEIRLDGNKLQSLPDTFKKLKNLHVLDLYDNIFSELPVVLLDLQNLEACDIDFNFFAVDSLFEQEYVEFIKKYTVLKNKMRVLIALKNPKCSREDGKKNDNYADNNSEEGDDDPAYDLEDISSDEFIEPDRLPLSENCDKKLDDVENWDVSDDSDSHFDPNFQRIRKTGSYGPSLLVYDSVSTSSEHFCPADIHSEPIRRGRRYDAKPVAEGQFDDADL